ncbi:MAG: PKD domain-containing protein, partial [Candidatus Thermoplasmatota archaeon]|nr:PKD domain-containing protein [Candidatus Thermoplasmatota archaeon]
MRRMVLLISILLALLVIIVTISQEGEALTDTIPPEAVAGPDITVDMGEDFTLNGADSTDNVGIVNYTWTIDPGGLNQTLFGSKVTTNITQVGIYTVRLRVEDAAGKWAEDFLEITVLDAEPPVADAGEDVTIEQGTAIDLNGSGSTDNIGIVSWSWTFQDGTATISLQGGSRTYVFQTPGTFQVQLAVMDARGFVSTDIKVVTVIEAKYPYANAGKDQRVIVGSIVTFDGSRSTDNLMIISHTWTFDYQGSIRELIG